MRRLLPLLFAGAVLAQLDRVNVAIASLTMNRDIGLSAGAYGLIAGALFVVYALFETPATRDSRGSGRGGGSRGSC